MAKRTEAHNSLMYTMHATKQGGKPLGNAPILVESDEEFAQRVHNAPSGELELIHNEQLRGHTIRLQGMIRTTSAGGMKFTDSEFARIANNIGAEQLKGYVGQMEKLRTYCKELWELERKDVDTDEYNADIDHWWLVE